MRTRRDACDQARDFEEEFQRVYDESYRKAKHEGNMWALGLLLTIVFAGLFGWFVFGPWLSSL